MNSVPERLTRLETKIEHVEETVSAIRATQLEIRDTVVSARAVGSAAKSGLAILRHAYPPITAIIAALVAVKYGLPRV